MNEELMDKIIEKCGAIPAYAEALINTLGQGALSGFSNEELASVCMMGWMIGTDPDLGEMINNMAKISKMGLDIVEK